MRTSGWGWFCLLGVTVAAFSLGWFLRALLGEPPDDGSGNSHLR